MSKVIYFADVSNGRPGRGATIRLDSGEPCLISIAKTGVLVKKSRYGFMGSILYNERIVYKAAATAMALSERFPDSLLPHGFSDPVLSAFPKAVLHCTTCTEVAVVLNKAPMDAPPPTKNGATPESAIRIRAANSIEGIPKLYATLTAMFDECMSVIPTTDPPQQ